MCNQYSTPSRKEITKHVINHPISTIVFIYFS